MRKDSMASISIREKVKGRQRKRGEKKNRGSIRNRKKMGIIVEGIKRDKGEFPYHL